MKLAKKKDLVIRKELKKTYFKKKIRETSPLDYSKLSVDVEKKWIRSLKKKNGEMAETATHENCRSALGDLRRYFGIPMEPGEAAQFKLFFKGMKVQAADRAAAGGKKIASGKRAMDFGLYQKFSTQFLRDSPFAHTFMVLSWNLMCRAGNVAEISFSHLSWHADHLQIHFAHTKTDTDGSKQASGRAIYANPLNPAICPILSLAILFANFGLAEDQRRIFDSKEPYERYIKDLKRVAQSKEFEQVLEELNSSPSEWGSHSLRKGAVSFVVSGSVDGPSAIAVCLRAGWTLGSVQDRYFFSVERAGDEFVGRTVCGLPHNSGEFAILPPFFENGTPRELIEEMIRTCFPKAPKTLYTILEMLLASLVYHYDYLVNFFPQNNSLFSFPLFADKDLFDRVRPHVVCRHAKPADPMQATGCSNSCVLLAEARQGRIERQEIKEAQANIPQMVCDRFREVWEEKAAEMGHITMDSLTNILDNKFAEIAASMESRFGNVPVDVPEPALQEQPVRHLYDGRLHVLPETYKLPKGTPRAVWIDWVCGRANHPALRDLQPIEFPAGSRKRLSELRFVMEKAEAKVRDAGLWKDDMSVAEATAAFAEIDNMLGLPTETPGKGKKRRTREIQWTTVAKELRQQKKAVVPANRGGERARGGADQ